MSAVVAGRPADENLMPDGAAALAHGVGPRRALYIDSPVYAQSAYGPHHPLAIARTQTVAEICRLNGWLPEIGRAHV